MDSYTYEGQKLLTLYLVFPERFLPDLELIVFARLADWLALRVFMSLFPKIWDY